MARSLGLIQVGWGLLRAESWPFSGRFPGCPAYLSRVMAVSVMEFSTIPHVVTRQTPMAAARLADGSFKGMGLEQGPRLLARTCPFCKYRRSVTLAASGAKPGLVFNCSHRTLF